MDMVCWTSLQNITSRKNHGIIVYLYMAKILIGALQSIDHTSTTHETKLGVQKHT